MLGVRDIGKNDGDISGMRGPRHQKIEKSSQWYWTGCATPNSLNSPLSINSLHDILHSLNYVSRSLPFVGATCPTTQGISVTRACSRGSSMMIMTRLATTKALAIVIVWCYAGVPFCYHTWTWLLASGLEAKSGATMLHVAHPVICTVNHIAKTFRKYAECDSNLAFFLLSPFQD